MPIYEYGCPACGDTFEELRTMPAMDEPAWCPRCATRAKRRVSAFVANTTFRPNDARLPSQPAVTHVNCSCCGPRRTRTVLRRT
jgi:putative FmdB family regulatory protein